MAVAAILKNIKITIIYLGRGSSDFYEIWPRVELSMYGTIYHTVGFTSLVVFKR